MGQEVAEFAVIGVGRGATDDVTRVNIFQGMPESERLEL